ncbi:hypothetical protein BCEP4_220172 [Burkholderia cepacia]|nr:hypothetical protein BCEP4_220172 [Burkholderia cepacia]
MRSRPCSFTRARVRAGSRRQLHESVVPSADRASARCRKYGVTLCAYCESLGFIRVGWISDGIVWSLYEKPAAWRSTGYAPFDFPCT